MICLYNLLFFQSNGSIEDLNSTKKEKDLYSENEGKNKPVQYGDSDLVSVKYIYCLKHCVNLSFSFLFKSKEISK